jgi:hypothetical protein
MNIDFAIYRNGGFVHSVIVVLLNKTILRVFMSNDRL